MPDSVAVETSSGNLLRAVLAAIETGVPAAKDRVATAEAIAEETLPTVSCFLSRFVYATRCMISYRFVFPTVLMARLVPVNNTVAHSFLQGAWAAIEPADQLKRRRLVSTPSESSSSLSLTN